MQIYQIFNSCFFGRHFIYSNQFILWKKTIFIYIEYFPKGYKYVLVLSVFYMFKKNKRLILAATQ